jgi:predicted branched-subunit amino acid permease
MDEPTVVEDAPMTEHHRHRPAPLARREERRRAVMDVLPLLLGYLPFALLVGSRVAADDPLSARWLSSILVMGGSAQLAVLELLDGGATVVLVVVTAVVLNARLLTYSASLAPHWSVHSRRFRLIAALGIIDPTWALADRRHAVGDDPHRQRTYVVTMLIALCGGWVAAITIGAVLGSTLDLSFASLAVPLCLFTLVVPALATTAGRRAAGTAAVVAWVGAGLPAGTGVLLAIAAGAATALVPVRTEAS